MHTTYATVANLRPHDTTPAWEPPAPFDQGPDPDNAVVARTLLISAARHLDSLAVYAGDRLDVLAVIDGLRSAARS